MRRDYDEWSTRLVGNSPPGRMGDPPDSSRGRCSVHDQPSGPEM
jgi:hypothetical protein